MGLPGTAATVPWLGFGTSPANRAARILYPGNGLSLVLVAVLGRRCGVLLFGCPGCHRKVAAWLEMRAPRRGYLAAGSAAFPSGVATRLACRFLTRSRPSLDRTQGTKASASISTSISGEINALTWTIDVAGRTSRKNSPCALPTCSQSAMLIT